MQDIKFDGGRLIDMAADVERFRATKKNNLMDKIEVDLFEQMVAEI